MNENKIKVLQIVPTLGYGGVAQFILNYYAQMDKSRISFDFVTHGGVEFFHQELINQGSKIYYHKTLRQVGIRKYLLQLKSIFNAVKYDCVHTHDGHLTGFTAMLCKLFYRGPVICHAHTTRCINERHKPLMPFFRLLSRHYGDLLLGCGIKACEFCYGKHANFTVIHNAVSLERFFNVSIDDAMSLKRELSIPNNSMVIGHIGYFSPPKNHYYILQIFSRFLLKHENAVLILVGDGPMRSQIESMSKELGIYSHIRFVGIQHNIPLYMHIFDSFILPSLYEGLPVCAVEAQTVVGNVCLSDVIDHDVDAQIGNVHFLPISKNDIEKWCDAIESKPTVMDCDIVTERFIRCGYEISSSVKSLFDQYVKIVS